MKRNKTMIVVFLAPALIIFCAIFIYPILRTIVMSLFKVENVTSNPDQWIFVGIENYKTLIHTSLFQIALWNLARIWLIGGIVVLSLALLFAVILNSGIRFKFYRALIYAYIIVLLHWRRWPSLSTIKIRFINHHIQISWSEPSCLINGPIPIINFGHCCLLIVSEWSDTIC